MKLEEVDIKSELSFVLEVELNRNGMIKEIKTEFDIIRMCLPYLRDLNKNYIPMINRIIVMPLRKLLCDDNSVLLKVFPGLMLPPIIGQEIALSDGIKIIHLRSEVATPEEWLPIKLWQEQRIAWIERSVSDLPDVFYDFVYQCIENRITHLPNKEFSKQDKSRFFSLFERKTVLRNSSEEIAYVRVGTADESNNLFVFSTLKKIGYYDLSVFNFLKHLSDKRGAHIDVGHSPLIELVNSTGDDCITPVLRIALQTIWAVKCQIPEMEDYWPEMELSQL